MRKTASLPVLLFMLAGGFIQAQSVPPIQWQKTFGGGLNDWISSSCQTPDGGFILQGTTSSNNGDAAGNHGNYDVLVIKTDASGNVQWKRIYGGAGMDIGGNIINTMEGGYLFGGTSGSADGDVSGNHGASDYWIVKLDPAGNIQWQRCYGGTGADNLFTVKQNSDGGYMAVGNTVSSNGDLTINYGSNDAWVIKISSTGNLLWQKSYGGSGQDLPNDIIEMTGGDLIFCGGSYSSNGDLPGNYGDKDVWLERISGSDGSMVWSQHYGGSQFDDLTSLQMTQDETISVAACGYTFSNDYNITGNHGSADVLLVTLDGASGVLNSARCYGGSNFDNAFNIAPAFDQGYFITGASASNDGDVSGNKGSTDVWALKINISGNIDWQKCLGGSSQERSFHGMETAEGGYFVSGGSYSNDGDVTGNKGGEDLWAVKLSECFAPPAFTATITANSNACGAAVSMAVPGGIPYTYQWKKNGANISGATARIYTATAKGTYTCVVKNGGCGSTGSPNAVYNFPQTATITPTGTVNKCTADPVNFTANTGSDLTYQWYRGATSITGANSSTYSTKKPGRYKVAVMNTATGCLKNSPVTTVNNTCRETIAGEDAILDVEPHVSLAAWPNPANNNVTLKINGDDQVDGTLLIYDITGKLKYKTLVHELQKVKSLSIITQDWANGMYYGKLVAAGDNSILSSVKIVVQH